MQKVGGCICGGCFIQKSKRIDSWDLLFCAIFGDVRRSTISRDGRDGFILQQSNSIGSRIFLCGDAIYLGQQAAVLYSFFSVRVFIYVGCVYCCVGWNEIIRCRGYRCYGTGCYYFLYDSSSMLYRAVRFEATDPMADIRYCRRRDSGIIAAAIVLMGILCGERASADSGYRPDIISDESV